MEEYIEAARGQFPRLYFLSGEEMVDLLAVSRNPRALLPTVTKVFSGITSLTFDLPPDAATTTSLDYALNGE